MKVLVINCGSSSLKFRLIETDKEEVIAKGLCERIGSESAHFVYEPAGGEKNEKENISLVVCTCKYSASGNRSTDWMQ